MTTTTDTDHAERTAQLMDTYCQLVRGERDDEETLLVDVLADLMHWASAVGVAFDWASDRALAHFAAEQVDDVREHVTLIEALPMTLDPSRGLWRASCVCGWIGTAGPRPFALAESECHLRGNC